MADANVNAIYTTLGAIQNTDYLLLNISDTNVNTIGSAVGPGHFFTDPPELSPTAVADFVKRYTSLDAFSCLEDGSDIGYLRVLRFNNGLFGSQVFPNENIMTYPDSDVPVLNPQIYQDFIVTNLSSALVEKAQIIKTNSTLQVYSFDAQPEVLAIQGVLKSTLGDYWDMQLVMLWDNLLRLKQLTIQNLIVEFGYQGNIYWGYPLNFSWQKNANSQMVLSYSMQFLVIKRTILTRSNLQIALANSIKAQLQNLPA